MSISGKVKQQQHKKIMDAASDSKHNVICNVSPTIQALHNTIRSLI